MVWQQRKVRHAAWSDGSLSLQGCVEMWFPLISKSQISVSNTVLQKSRSLMPCGKQEENKSFNTIGTAVANNNSSEKPFWPHKPQLAGQLCPAQMTERLVGHVVLSDWIFLGSVGRALLQNFSACLPLGQQERNAKFNTMEHLSQTNNYDYSVKPFWATRPQPTG